MAQNGEASVEEILESIKKVIGRDNRELGQRQRSALSFRTNASANSEPVAEPDIGNDADDWPSHANAMPDDRPGEGSENRDDDAPPAIGPSIAERPEPASEEEADEVLDLADMEAPDTPGAALTEDDGPLVADAVRGAMQENLATLAMLSEPGARPQVARSGETSLEGLTRELLRPMLSRWLDENLPAMVEKLVQAEISRIAGKRR